MPGGKPRESREILRQPAGFPDHVSSLHGKMKPLEIARIIGMSERLANEYVVLIDGKGGIRKRKAILVKQILETNDIWRHLSRQ